MKKLFTTILSICAISSLFAQTIPNASFENWTKIGNYYNPDQWATLNDYTAPANLFTCYRTTQNPNPPTNGGSAYVSLSTRLIAGQMLPGLAFSGMIDSFTYDAIAGFACKSAPAKLTGKSMYYISDPSDYAFVSVLLKKYNSTTKDNDTIAYGIKKFEGSALTWTDFSFDINYRSNQLPDTCMIILSSSGDTPKALSSMHIDLLAFSGTHIGISENENVKSFNVYPNPTKDKINLDINLKSSSLLNINILDIQGKIIKSSESLMNIGDNKVTFDLSDVQKGIYFIKLFSDGSSVTQKMIIE